MSAMMTQEEAMNMSNEQAIQILIPMRNMMCDQNGCPISDAVFALDKAIEALSADRPSGEWIDRSGGIEGAWNYCSVCGEQAIDLYDFCPNCGADMREKGDEYCETCRFELYCPEMCEGCCKWDSHYESKDESTISKMEQVDKDINVRSKNEL